MSAEAGRARATDATDPLDANSVAELDGTRLNARTKLDDSADTRLNECYDRVSQGRRTKPLCSTQGSQVDENFARTRLGHVETDDLGRDFARLVVDASLVSPR